MARPKSKSSELADDGHVRSEASRAAASAGKQVSNLPAEENKERFSVKSKARLEEDAWVAGEVARLRNNGEENIDEYLIRARRRARVRRASSAEGKSGSNLDNDRLLYNNDLELTPGLLSAIIAAGGPRGFIDQNEAERISKLDLDEKIARLEQAFPKSDRGLSIGEVLKILFPELTQKVRSGTSRSASAAETPSTSEPSSSAARWADRDAGDTPISFVRKHYGIWREGVWDPNGLTKPDLRNDMALYQALASYERRHPDEALNLPTKKQSNDSWVDRVLSGAEAPTTPLEKERFAAAAKRRGKLSQSELG